MSAQSFIITNKVILENIVNVVKELHYKITKKEYKNTLTFILKELYKSHKNSSNGSFEKDYYSGIVREMCTYVYLHCNATKSEVYATWLKIAIEGQLKLNFHDMMILDFIKEFFFGYLQTYRIVFEQKDIKTGYGRYYYMIKLEFTQLYDVPKTTMYISVTDTKQGNHLYTSNQNALSMINNSFLTTDGFIAFDVTKETLTGLARYLYYYYNNYGFKGGFELYPLLSMNVSFDELYLNHIGCPYKEYKKYQEHFNDYTEIRYCNKQLYEVLCPY